MNTSAIISKGTTRIFQPMRKLKLIDGIKETILSMMVKAVSKLSDLKKIQEVMINAKL